MEPLDSMVESGYKGHENSYFSSVLLTEHFIWEEGGILFYFLFFIQAKNSDEGGRIFLKINLISLKIWMLALSSEYSLWSF